MTTEERSKFQSRKFLVWIVWLVISILIIGFCAVVMVVTKQILESMTGLIENTLGYFFAISMMYLGMNAGQKIGTALADSLSNKKEGENK